MAEAPGNSLLLPGSWAHFSAWERLEEKQVMPSTPGRSSRQKRALKASLGLSPSSATPSTVDLSKPVSASVRNDNCGTCLMGGVAVEPSLT